MEDNMGNGNVTKEHVNDVMNSSVADKTEIANPVVVKQQFESKDKLHYIKSDDYNANPASLLGSVYYEKDQKKELIPFILGIDGKIDEASLLKAPLTRSEMIVDAKTAASADIMSYLTLSLSTEEVFEFRVIDNFSGRLFTKGKEWQGALASWMADQSAKDLINDNTVGAIGIVTGIVQKYISTKKFKKYDAKAKGGYFGVNVGGELYTSSSEYALDIVYGLNLVYWPRVPSVKAFEKEIALDKRITDKASLIRLDKSFALSIEKYGGKILKNM
jgi:hypothetical protein